MSNERNNYGNLRLAIDKDIPGIVKLVSPTVKEIFRLDAPTDKLHQLINCSVLAITQLDNKQEVIGFLALDDFPIAAAVDPGVWEDWAWSLYRVVELNSRNNLFVSALIWSTLYGRNVVKRLLTSVFMHDQYLKYITMYKPPPDARLNDDIHVERLFRRVNAYFSSGISRSVPSLYIAARKDICPSLTVRKAVESDNDYVVDIIDAQSDRLKEMYGSYYVSELLARHPESNRTLLVAEQNQMIVGMMCFNENIDYGNLCSSYDLMPFSGLAKITINQLPLFTTNISNLPEKPKGIEIKEMFSGINKRDSIVNQDLKRKMLSRDASFSNPSIHSKKVCIKRLSEDTEASEGSNFNILEILAFDDDFDYEIVNIDSNLLKLPKFVTFETFVFGDVSPNHSEEDDKYKWEEISNRLSTDIPVVQKENPGVYCPPSDEHCINQAPNAFVLELFAMDESVDERRGFEILVAGFQLYPQFDYCILMLPTATKTFPLLKHFTRVCSNTNRSKNDSEALYIVHRNSICVNISVRLGEVHDMPIINTLINKLPKREELENYIKDGLHGSNYTSVYQTYMFLSENQPVGLLTLNKLYERICIRSAFNLDRSAQCIGAEGNILSSVLSPVLDVHSRWFVREVMRLSGYRIFIWKSRFAGRGLDAPAYNLISLVDVMAPAFVRSSSKIKDGSKSVLWEVDKSIWYIDRPLTSSNKLDVNDRILIVGASQTALAFIEQLLFGPSSMYLTFTNLCLISSQGLPIVVEYIKPAETCFPDYNNKYKNLHLHPFFFYVDMLTGKVVHINRKSKFVRLDNGVIKHYDYLILSCGIQFVHPGHTLPGKNRDFCRSLPLDNPSYRPEIYLIEKPPENLMLINSIIDANDCLSRLIKMKSDLLACKTADRKIIVYGNKIEAYTCIASMLETRLISGELIVFINPSPHNVAEDMDTFKMGFNDDEVDDRVLKAIQSLGITIVTSYKLFDFDVTLNRIHNVRFISAHQIICFSCLAFFYFGHREVDFNTFSAINECGLVWDGGLVIDSDFRTNDPYIYACGTMTKYSHALHADRSLHGYFNPYDVGSYLSERFLGFLDPFRQSNPPSECSKLTPSFKSPCSCYGILPGGFHYLRVVPPGPTIPVLVRRTLATGHVLTTQKNGNRFLLHLDCHHRVRRITCLSRKPFSSHVILMLYGKHEKLLGNLLQRYVTGRIDDFFEYFEQPWISALAYGILEDITGTLEAQYSLSSNFSGLHLDLNKILEESTLSEVTDAIRLLIYRNQPTYELPLHPDFLKLNIKL